ncbi:dihydrofolate reductase [Mumia flava]|uniref:Dihydrofolate reductase n=1 Tax=Mumia flava TaxID=1348852 RepID=A0A0B2BJQ6_9ACTN|nr:dihydrofolate reductase family protein [Mumia flava]PJJ57455.1 dihydrofolate reductase [Mumia flava]
MRRIIVSMWTTVDGYVAGPDDEMDWLMPDEAMAAYETALVTGAEALLLGRTTHGDFAETWPRIAGDEAEPPANRDYARRVDAMPKFVVSKSGRTASWRSSTRISSLDHDDVARLRAGGDGDLVVYGSLSVIAALQRIAAVDEYHLLLHPTAIGAGKALFTRPARLRLESAEPFPSGVTLMRYVPTTHEE